MGELTHKRNRIESIDLLRGLVMAIMLLDHTRLYLHSDSQHINPTDLSETNAVLFLTRWITHMVAPVFILLAGSGAYLQIARGKSKDELSRFLMTRGLWLIFLEFTIVRLGINFNLDYGTFLGSMQVIWVIGLSMIILGLLIYLPFAVTAGIGIILIIGHNLLDGIHVASWKGPGSPVPGPVEVLWLVLHQPGEFLLCGMPCPRVYVLYPLIPWVGVMAVGFTLGAIYKLHPGQRQRLLISLGAALTAFFFIIRGMNLYGDPHPWEPQKSALFTILSFLNVTKYPPSLLFLLLTLGPAIAALAWFEKIKQGQLKRVLITFGQVPIFFYLLQFYVAHGLAILMGWLAGQPIAYQYTPGARAPQGVGFGLWVVYLFWICGLIVLYPLCHWFAGIKDKHRTWWLSYL